MFPMMGLFLIFIPIGGFLLALSLGFIRPLRFLASFTFFIPLLGAYTAVAGFWGLGLAMERGGSSGWVVGLSCWLGLLAGGAIGSVLGLGFAFGLYWMGRRILRSFSGP